MTTFTRAAVAALTFAAASGATAAMAGECAKADRLSTPQTIEMQDGSGVEAVVLSTVPLDGWRGVDGLMLRTRRLTIAPGGIVPTHSHGDRPAIIVIVSGEIDEHNSVCAKPIHHVAGDETGEFGADLSHWWENTSDTPVVILSSDVVPVEEPTGDSM
ncbi:cupin [Acuticoccus sediminis]|uniref:Cupin n=1 Tax=Acuticoccus sediminis TaxID=2184697 RepID=A0A8B2NJ96_9HYPH|nr:cupin [Acuticoccus sediminis]RAH98356.1 cupin [Acuticoccus sediminis]